MPHVRIEITAGATREQKRALVSDVTRSLAYNLGKRPEHVHIVIDEVAEENWGFAGQLTDEWRAAQKGGAHAKPSQ